MKEPRHVPPIIEVEWVDSMHRVEWESEESMREVLQIKRRYDHLTSGYLFDDSPRAITIIQSMGVAATNFDAAMSIPRESIRKVTIIRKGRDIKL